MKFRVPSSEFRVKTATLTRNSELETRNSKLETRNSKLHNCPEIDRQEIDRQECLSYIESAMQSLLVKMLGKKIDVYCGGASSLRGEVLKIEDGVLYLKDSDDKTCYVAIDKIMVVWEARDEEHRAGFVSSTP